MLGTSSWVSEVCHKAKVHHKIQTTDPSQSEKVRSDFAKLFLKNGVVLHIILLTDEEINL